MTGSLPADLDQSAAEALEELSRDPKCFGLTNLTGGEGRFWKIGSIAQEPKSKRTEKPLLAANHSTPSRSSGDAGRSCDFGRVLLQSKRFNAPGCKKVEMQHAAKGYRGLEVRFGLREVAKSCG